MRTTLFIATAAFGFVTAACALDTPRELLKKLFSPHTNSRGHDHDTHVAHCGVTQPHAGHHWNDVHGHHAACPGVPWGGLILDQCPSLQAHATHVWQDAHGHFCQCPGVKNLAVVSC